MQNMERIKHSFRWVCVLPFEGEITKKEKHNGWIVHDGSMTGLIRANSFFVIAYVAEVLFITNSFRDNTRGHPIYPLQSSLFFTSMEYFLTLYVALENVQDTNSQTINY